MRRREREKKEARVDYETAIQDIMEISKMLEGLGYDEGH